MPTKEQVAIRAYEIWSQRGGGHGHAAEDWLEAERQLARFTVVLEDAGKNKIGVIKQLRAITGLDLEKVRDLVSQLPAQLEAELTAAEAESVRAQLSAVGAASKLQTVNR